MKKTDSITSKLKCLIDANGPGYLTDEPYSVFKELIKAKIADRKLAGAILYLLVSGIPDEVAKADDVAVVTRAIQKSCCFNKGMADLLASIFFPLYSDENKQEWKAKDKAGLTEFLSEELSCSWCGFAVWDAGNGTVDCHYNAEILISPSNEVTKDKSFARILKENPFMTRKAIGDYFENELCEYLDQEFTEYCTCEDYYEPVVEDFEADYYVGEWCKKHGFEFISCEGNGHDDGFDPKFRRGWY